MRQFAIIGLGNFGLNVARTLYQKGHEVIGIDIDKNAVQRANEFTSQAIVADATNKEALAELGLKDVDVAVVALGERLDASILATLYLKELGVKEIIVKAISDDHAKVLEKIGATEVIFPERDMAIKAANRLSSPNLVDYLPLAKDHSIQEFPASNSFVGKPLRDLKLRNKYGVTVIAAKNNITDEVNIATAEYIVKKDDLLVVIGKDKDIEAVKQIK